MLFHSYQKPYFHGDYRPMPLDIDTFLIIILLMNRVMRERVTRCLLFSAFIIVDDIAQHDAQHAPLFHTYGYFMPRTPDHIHHTMRADMSPQQPFFALRYALIVMPDVFAVFLPFIPTATCSYCRHTIIVSTPAARAS